MAVTTTYSINNVVNEFTVNRASTNTSQLNSSVAMLTDGSFVATYDGNNFGDFVSSDQYDANGVFIRSDVVVNSTLTNDQKDSEITGLNNGGYVVVYEDDSAGVADTNIRFRRFDANGVAQGNDVNIGFAGFDEFDPSVATLANGRFAMSFELEFGANDIIYRSVRNENGTVNFGTNIVSDFVNQNALQSDVAGLADGGYVITWSQDNTNVAGTNWDMAFQVFNANNTARTGIIISDTAGSINLESDVIGMQDGRFAIVYRDNGWGLSGSEITLRIYNANGTTSSGFIRVNTNTTNNQTQPKITELSNGFLAVTWTHAFSATDDDVFARIFDSNGVAITNQFVVDQSGIDQNDSDIAALLNGRFVTTYTDAQTSAGDASNGHIGGEISELVRTSSSDGAGDTINGDNIRDIMNGNGGDDTLRGRGGNDTLNGGADNDRINGGLQDDTINGGGGVDRLLFTGNLGATADLAIAGPQNTGHGIDTITNMEDIRGSEVNDTFFGNALANKLDGRFGNDFLSGRDGNDFLVGRQGNDTMFGGAGRDKINGQGNNDFIVGGTGRDILQGGGGVNTFDYNNTNESGLTGGTRDTIKDFTIGSDRIDVSTIDANTTVGGNQAFVLDTGGAFVAGEIRQITLGNKEVLQFNTDGDVAPEMEIALLNVGTLNAGDFIL